MRKPVLGRLPTTVLSLALAATFGASAAAQPQTAPVTPLQSQPGPAPQPSPDGPTPPPPQANPAPPVAPPAARVSQPAPPAAPATSPTPPGAPPSGEGTSPATAPSAAPSTPPRGAEAPQTASPAEGNADGLAPGATLGNTTNSTVDVGPAVSAPPADAAATADTSPVDVAGPAGPTIELAEEHAPDDATPPSGDESLTARRASASVFSSLPDENTTTTIGGYAQINLTSVRRGFDADFETSATLRRLVLLFSHQITDGIAAYTELEWENAIACPTCSGSVEIEQAYVDWQLLGDALTLRSGLVLIPMGLINLWHEPPIFHGVDRPQFDQVLIPTTWRELGAGITGLLASNVEYQLYLTTTLVPSRLGPNGFVAARQLGSNSLSNAAALSGRVDYEPILGLSLSGSVFASDAGGNGDYFNAAGEQVDFTFPIVGGSLTARFNRRGWETRAVGAAFWMPEAGALMNARRADGSLLFPNADRTGAVPTRMHGGMVEVAYDVLRFADSSHQLLPFVRAETYDTQSAVPDEFLPNRSLSVQEWTFGLSYRPIRQLVFKTDVQTRDRRSGLDELQINAGMGYML